MQKLTHVEGTALTDPVIKMLFQSRIITILDFLQEDVEKLANICKLSIPQILEARNQILTQFSAPVINGSCFIDKIRKGTISIKSGVKNLDNMLNRGIPAKTITELCGIAGSGKTQLALQIAINCAKETHKTVLYIDTKGDFSALRIQKILEKCQYSFKEVAAIMNRIHISYIWTMEELVNLFKNLKNGELVIDNLMLLVIDSLPSLMFQYLGEDNKLGLSLLNSFVNYSRFICKQLNIGIICINMQTRWVDQDLTDVEDEENSTAYKDSFTEKRYRCLGRYWQHIPTLVLELERIKENDNENNSGIKVTVLHSIDSGYENRHCILCVGESGVT
ncbi:DNA repair protein RAD51 homolog 4 [Bombyx mandarina]|uniref:DNA repair protein RAD51 homolog 4 n=1 Tax=Bombyx mandarina TaxID=7092 RepID=A0A6J2JK23_BOMMA|nr:DNA repair protein RAD51 homolog 4 [Bombyx mandarina]